MTVNIRYVCWLLGLLIFLMCMSMSTAMAWSVYENYFEAPIYYQTTHGVKAFATSMAVGAAVAGILLLIGRGGEKYLGKREAMLLVSSSWFVGAAVAALPFWFWALQHDFLLDQDDSFLSFVNCFFEAMSGLTTTGATILSEIERIPKGLLFWRAFTHWIGGLGIVVIFVALLPSFGGRSKRLFALEASGITNEGITANVRETTRVLAMIYTGLTVLQIFLLKLVDPDLSWFDSLCHTFSTLATGGFSTYNASAGALSPGVQWVLIAFMFIAGINFGLYQVAWRTGYKAIWKSTELRVYLCMTIAIFGLVLFCIYDVPYQMSNGEMASFEPEQRIRDSLFQVLSIQSSTGYATVDFEQWSLLAKSGIVFLMFVGGCGGSTAGGIKVIRIVGMMKVLYAELEKSFRPRVVRTIRSGSHVLSEQQRIAVVAYVLGIVLMMGMGTIALLITEPTISGTTALSAMLACINNIGPGFDAVGAVQNYGWFSDVSKLLLCLFMAIGRLEVFAVVVIFMPRFWKYD